jgi:DNA-binding NarL/FixJ family response regulator
VDVFSAQDTFWLLQSVSAEGDREMDLNNSVSLAAGAPQKIRVMLADPYPVILCGLRKMIEDDGRFEVVAAVSTMTRFIITIREERPDVVLLDSHLAMRDPEMLSLLRAEVYIAAIILLTSSENVTDTDQREGFSALSKWCSAEKLVEEVSMAARVDSSSTSVPLVRADAATVCEDPALRIAQLTKRERQLLPLVCSGMKNKEIAKRLGIAESTVWHHLTSVFTKLEVEDRLGLVTFAYRHNLVREDGDTSAFPVVRSA